MNPRVHALTAAVPYRTLDVLHQIEELRTSLLLAGFDGAPGTLALARVVERCHRTLRRALTRYERVLWDAEEQAPGFASDASADEATYLPIETAARTSKPLMRGNGHA